MMKGKVKWFSPERGFGFIEKEDGNDIFVYYKDIQMNGFKTLEDGEEVTFEPEQTEKGYCARNVRRVY